MRLWRRLIGLSMATLAALVLSGAGYTPIPSGENGSTFHTDVDNRFSGAIPTQPQLVAYPLASIPAERDGQMVRCTDCRPTTPCTSGGAGAIAFGIGGQWSCAAQNALQFTLSSPSSAGNQPISGIATLTPNVDTGAQHTLADFSVNHQLNVRDPYFGATGSAQTATITFTSATTATASSIADFAAGQYVSV